MKKILYLLANGEAMSYCTRCIKVYMLMVRQWNSYPAFTAKGAETAERMPGFSHFIVPLMMQPYLLFSIYTSPQSKKAV